ncbi:uncharacterized protein K452DRAFT_232624 [Aplosporella prunicola CBS 121167]|uniref:Iron-sulfur assembly protein 1 n=1 Tax=Aplosporella prunicola CBS 121167 TaxID=1176127 RepID=A0A6A6B7R9_9PEZI|nr:uncharacterized protein K452DRAFT_232624 [Aplosporella prunicola CBS 121167]KAF2139413.1 hypothetical protein K452DRAFT_232624 [Aplosporella prunicola CBS 121167]
MFRFATPAARSTCSQCLRLRAPYSSSALRPARQLRSLQTATAYQPSQFQPPPPSPPRNAGVPETSVAGGQAQQQQQQQAELQSFRSGPAEKKMMREADVSAAENPTVSVSEAEAQKPQPAFAASAASPAPSPRPRRQLRPKKAAMTLTPSAVSALRELLDSPDPKLIRVGTKSKGCSGLAYHLEYVDKAGKFDDAVEQDGVKVLIDSKALLHILGSEMDWVEDKLSRRFVFKNPNITESCGCGESFSIS